MHKTAPFSIRLPPEIGCAHILVCETLDRALVWVYKCFQGQGTPQKIIFKVLDI